MPPNATVEDPQAAFVSELTRHQDSLRAYIISLMPGLPGAADVLQEANLTLWKKREQFEIGTNFTAWAFAVARYSVLSHRRKMRRDGRIVFSDELLERLAPPAEEVTPDRLSRRQSALEKCLAKLSDDQREMVERRYGRNTSLEQYAAEVDKTANSLRVALFRLRAALRRCINREFELTEANS